MYRRGSSVEINMVYAAASMSEALQCVFLLRLMVFLTHAYAMGMMA